MRYYVVFWDTSIGELTGQKIPFEGPEIEYVDSDQVKEIYKTADKKVGEYLSNYVEGSSYAVTVFYQGKRGNYIELKRP